MEKYPVFRHNIDMKICDICKKEINLVRATTCRSCIRKGISYRYQEKKKEELKEKQRIYRHANRRLCQKRSRASQLKKPEHYRLKRRENYRKKHGIPLDDPFVKRKAGEGSIDKQGYKTITVRGHPNQMDSKGRIREHVYVMSQYLNRPLIKGETVHHKNGDRIDNRIENLELWSKAQPPGQRIEDKIDWCIEFLLQRGYKVIKDK
jgi:hypothetical protein